MRTSGVIAVSALLLISLGSALAVQIIGFPLAGLSTNVASFDLATQQYDVIVEGLEFATSVYQEYGASDSETGDVFFHGLDMPGGHYEAVIRVNIKTQATSIVNLGAAENIKKIVPFWHAPSKTLYEWITFVPNPNKLDESHMVLARVDFNSKSLISIQKYDEYTDSDPAVVDDSTGTLYAIVGRRAAPPMAIAVNLATGENKTLPYPKVDRINGGVSTWVSCGWNAASSVISILMRNDSLMINGQRNFSVISWTPSTGDIAKNLPPFLFPPPAQFFGKIDTIATYFDTKLFKHFVALTDRSDTVGIVEVDALTGQPTDFSEFDHEAEPRQMVTLH